MNFLRASAALLAFCVSAAACGTEQSAIELDPAAETITAVDCPVGVSAPLVVCGLAEVTLDGSNPDAGTTTVSFAVKAGSDPEATTAMAVLQGGPGGASSGLAPFLPQQPYPQVFIDQRGTGFDGLDLDCPAYRDATVAGLSEPSDVAITLLIDALDRCAVELTSLSEFDWVTTENHAADVAAVMAGLDYDSYVAYGVSHGSAIALEVLRLEPAGLVGAVLDAVSPPDIDVDSIVSEAGAAAVDAVTEACREDAQCIWTDLFFADTLAELISELDQSPVMVTIDGAAAGQVDEIDVYLDGDRLASFVFTMLYDESLVAALPDVLRGMANDQQDDLDWVADVGTRLAVGSADVAAEGTYFAVQCHNRLPLVGTGQPAPSSDAASVFGDAVASISLTQLCERWDQPMVDSAFLEPVSSELPVLLLSGEFDPIRPESLARQAAETLPNSTVVTQGGRGHGIWIGDACIGSLVAGFVADPEAVVDTGCVGDGVPIQWRVP